jgi:Fe2+ or Zn2+ uptake regulation protein
MHDENHEEGEHEHCDCMGCGMKKEFKLAMLEKKENILKVKLEFIAKMKKMIEKMPEHK